MNIFELLIVFLLALLYVVLASINHKLGRVARSLESLSLTSRNIMGITVDELTRPVAKVERPINRN